MARKQLISLAALAFIAAGCVSQEKYNALKLDRDRYAEQLGQAQNEASSARSEAEAEGVGDLLGRKRAPLEAVDQHVGRSTGLARLEREDGPVNRPITYWHLEGGRVARLPRDYQLCPKDIALSAKPRRKSLMPWKRR